MSLVAEGPSLKGGEGDAAGQDAEAPAWGGRVLVAP